MSLCCIYLPRGGLAPDAARWYRYSLVLPPWEVYESTIIPSYNALINLSADNNGSTGNAMRESLMI